MDFLKISKKKIKAIAVFLCVCLIVGMSVNQAGLLQFTKAADVWDGNMPVAMATTYSGSTGSNGSISKPFVLASAKDLAQFAVNVNSGMYSGQTIYVNLQADIDMANKEWVPIGTATSPFTGVFDGGNHSITNMKLTIGGDVCKTTTGIGLFGVTESASISNIALTGTVSQGANKDGTNVGGLIGRGDTTSVTNCSFKGNVAGNQYVGGLIGTSEGSSSSKCVLSNCKVLDGSTVTSTNYAAGGIIGYAATQVRIINSFNRADVTTDSSNTQAEQVAAAGVVGATGDGFVEIINCYNTGNITSSYLASGIINGKNITARVCYNAGVVSTSSNAEVGGISATGSSNSQGNTFESCFYLQDGNTGVYSAYPGSFAGSARNIGTIANNQDYTYLVKLTTLEDSKWTLGTQKILLDGLNDGVSAWAESYSGILEWGYDSETDYVVNKGYPIHTNKVGHTHNRSKEEVVKEATCTEEGTVRYTCSICGHPEVVSIPAKKHNYQVKVLTPASCEVSGVSANVCINDGCTSQLESWEVAPIGHRWLENVTHAATCVEDGKVQTECQNSGCTAVREVAQTLPALGHDIQTRVIPRTCTEDETVVSTCSRCNYQNAETTSGTALGHEWDSVTGVSVESTCTVHGGMVRTCKRCKLAQTMKDAQGNDIIYPYADHKYVDTIVPPTCDEDGYTHHVCSVCNSELNDTYVNPLGHTCIATVVEPTCSEKGYTRHQCNNCDYFYDDTEVTATALHSYVKDEAKSVPATCLSEGLDVFVCEYCNEAKIEETIPSLGGHKYVYSADSSVPQSCENGGYDMWICKVCLAEEKRNVTHKGFGHSYAGTVHPPTCLDDGYTEYVCGTCSDSYIDDNVPALGHSYDEEVIPPTTTTRGYTLYSCSMCDEEYESDYVAASPNASFDYSTCTLTLSDMDELMMYSLDGGNVWDTVEVSAVAVSPEALVSPMAITTEMAVSPEAVVSVAGIMVKRPGNDVLPLADSEIQTIAVIKSVMPEAVLGVSPSLDRPGMIVGLNTSMEYRMEGSEEWLPVMSEILEGLEEGVYYIRVKATETSLASEAKRIEIKAEETPAPGEETTPPAVSVTPGGVTAVPTPSSVVTDVPLMSATPTVTPTATGLVTDEPSGSPSMIPGTTTPVISGKPSGTPVPTGNNGGTGSGSGSGNNGGTGSNAGSGSNDGSGSVSGNGNGSGNNGGTGNGSGSKNGSPSATATPGVVANSVYYSTNGGATGSGTGSTVRTSTYKAAKTGDDSNAVVWIIIAATAMAAVVVTRKRNAEQ